jgi:subtilisin family serine protease
VSTALDGYARIVLLRAALASLIALLLIAAPAAAADPLRPRQWGLDMVEANAAYPISTGTGAVVAVVDTGVQSDHHDLTGQVLPGHDFVENDDTPQDGNGHGTHIAGIVAAITGNGIGVESVAPGARVLPVRVLNSAGDGDSNTVAAGVDWAVDHGADVINLSLGSSLPLFTGDDTTFNAAVARALDRGVIVAAAAGNDGLPICEQPLAEGRLLCVGAVDRRGDRSFFSNFGQGLGIMAPGGSALPGDDEDVLSTWNEGRYAEAAGTSQATGFVSGVAALLVSKGIRGQAAVQRIRATARDAGAPGPDAQYGAGIVDAARAVTGLGSANGSTASGSSPGSSTSTGGGGQRPGAGSPGAAARVTAPRRISKRALLRRGLAIHCTASGTGTCAATVRLRGAQVARGARPVTPGKRVTIDARVTRSGRRTLRRPGRLKLSLTVQAPGAPAARLRVIAT